MARHTHFKCKSMHNNCACSHQSEADAAVESSSRARVEKTSLDASSWQQKKVWGGVWRRFRWRIGTKTKRSSGACQIGVQGICRVSFGVIRGRTNVRAAGRVVVHKPCRKAPSCTFHKHITRSSCDTEMAFVSLWCCLRGGLVAVLPPLPRFAHSTVHSPSTASARYERQEGEANGASITSSWLSAAVAAVAACRRRADSRRNG